jgi:hypothetical protein
VVIGTDCIVSCKWNYHTIMTTTTPLLTVENMIITIGKLYMFCLPMMLRSNERL